MTSDCGSESGETCMSPCGASWIRTGAILAGLAVCLGAFAAHRLDKELARMYSGQTRVVVGEEVPAARKYLADFKTAAEYQMTHALGIIAAGIVLGVRGSRLTSAAAWCFLLGILLFSGSLYALVLSGKTILGAITPIGGLLFIAAWILLALGAGSSRQRGAVDESERT
jgi:uncharacterized membrane protein YgdD (TMEM256/DUF423 family)